MTSLRDCQSPDITNIDQLGAHLGTFLPITIHNAQIISLTQELTVKKKICKHCSQLSRSDGSYHLLMTQVSGHALEARLAQFYNKRFCSCNPELVGWKSQKVAQRKALVRIGDNHLSGFLPIYLQFNSDDSIYVGARYASIQLVQMPDCDPRKLNAKNPEFDALQVTKKVSFTKNIEMDIAVEMFPEIFQRLYDDFLPPHISSDWSYALTLAYYFGDSICPSGSYFRLKLGLLLSILSMDEMSKNRESSILAIGQDSLILSRLFTYASKMTQAMIHSSPLLPINATSRLSRKLDTTWIDAGTLLLADTGVCVIAGGCNLNCMKEKDKVLLKQALETDKVLMNLPSRGKDDDTQTAGMLRSTVWTYIDQPNMIKSKILWKEIFGMIYPVQITNNDTWVFFVDKKYKKIPLAQWQQFIQVHNNYSRVNMLLSSEAELLIQGYFIAIRRVRGQQCHRLSMSTLTQLAKAFAKLSVRSHVVTKSDALMAILLYEEMLTELTGDDPLNVNPIAHVEGKLEDIIAKCNEDLQELDKNLIEMIQDFYLNTTSASQLPPEE